jgi:hypothetical protein
VGVGNSAAQLGHRCIDGASWFALVVGVSSNDPDPVPSVSRIDGTSRNNKRPRGVAEGFQVSQHIIECQRDEASNVFAKEPSGSFECNNAAHFRPEVAVVRLCFLLSGDAEGLAGESSADEIDSSKPTQSLCVQGTNIIEARDSRPVLAEDGSAELVSLAEGDCSHPGSLKSETESSDAGKEVKYPHRPTSGRVL